MFRTVVAFVVLVVSRYAVIVSLYNYHYHFTAAKDYPDSIA